LANKKFAQKNPGLMGYAYPTVHIFCLRYFGEKTFPGPAISVHNVKFRWA